MLHEIRYTFRTLRQRPGFTAAAVVSIALGIGANAAIFSLADGLLLRPVPVPDPGQVVRVSMRTPRGGFSSFSYTDFTDFRARARSYQGMAAFDLEPFSYAPDIHSQAQLKMGFLVSGDFFQVLRVTPALGRPFAPLECEVPGRDPVVILSHDLWKNEFSADPSAVGRTIRLNGKELTVVGIAPEEFSGMDQYVRPAFFIPLMMGPALLRDASGILTDRNYRAFDVRGRLRPGVSVDAASAEAAAVAKALEETHPETNRAMSAIVRTELRARLDEDVIDAVLVSALMALVAVVLAIACANVANLMLSRGRARAREIAVRLSLGASRSRLIRQLMAESVTIAAAGGALGLLIAFFAIRLFATVRVAGDTPVFLQFELDGRVLAFTIAISAVSALLFGLVPALRSTSSDLVTALKTGTAEPRRFRIFGRNALVTLQVAAALVLLMTATQLARGFSMALNGSPGFRTDHLLSLRMDTALAGYSAAQTEIFQRTLVDRARQVPGVRSVALNFSLPMTNDFRQETLIPEGHQFLRGEDRVNIFSDRVDEGFFTTLGVPLLLGRGFRETDREGSPPVIVVNEAFARHYLGTNPIGKRIRLRDKNGPVAEVVGVTVTGKHMSIFEPEMEFVYLPLRQHALTRFSLLVQSNGDAGALAAPLREMIRAIDPGMPVFGIRNIADLYNQRSVRVARIIDGIVGSSGLIGLSLALVGLYAVVAYQVARRTREIGIRVALGADRPMVMKLVLRQAWWIGLVGVSIGMAISLASARALTAGLGSPAFDPVSLVLFPAGLLLTTLVAAALPARRASRIDPMQALREE